MNKQEIFDKVATHLLTQKCKSLHETTERCMYRGAGGTMCAVGVLIPDEEYSTDLEMSISSLYESPHLLEKRPVLSSLKTHVDLLSDLQYIHDNRDVGEWASRLKNLALGYELDSSVMNQF